MAVFKCTALFSQSTNLSGNSEGNRQGGWSESIYRVISSEDAVHQVFQQLCQTRAALLGNGAAIIGQRYQKVEPIGRSAVGSTRYPGNSGWPIDVPQLALTFVLFSADSLNSRRFTLRGIPHQFCVEGEFKPDGNFLGALFLYVQRLALFQFRARGTSAPKAVVNTVANTGAVFLAADLTVTPGQRVWIAGVKFPSEVFNADWYTVNTVTDARHFTLVNWPFGNGTGGTAETSTTIYPTFEGGLTQVPSSKIVVRKVGRPFGGYRGRASNRV